MICVINQIDFLIWWLCEQCLQQSNGEIGKCQFYHDMLNQVNPQMSYFSDMCTIDFTRKNLCGDFDYIVYTRMVPC